MQLKSYLSTGQFAIQNGRFVFRAQVWQLLFVLIPIGGIPLRGDSRNTQCCSGVIVFEILVRLMPSIPILLGVALIKTNGLYLLLMRHNLKRKPIIVLSE